MSARTIIVVILALVCGLCAAVGIQGMRKTPRAVAEVVAEPIPKESVVVVVTPLAQGQVIQAEGVELHELPKAIVPPGALRQTADAVGHRAQIPMVKGDTLTERMLIVNGGTGLGPRVPAGWRAFTIVTASPSSSLAGALTKGDRVDVLFTATNQATPQILGSRAAILLQDVEILSVNPKDESAITNKIAPNEVLSATLLVRIHEAAALDQAQATGMLHLALRNPGGDHLPSPDEMARRVTRGNRAITIRAKNLTAMVTGLLLTGDFVDVLHTPRNLGGASGTPGLGEMTTIVEAVQILGVHTKVELPSKGQLDPIGELTVTLLVDPRQAEELKKVQDAGTLGLAVRRPGDPVKAGKAPAPSFVDTTEQTRTLRGTRHGADRFTTRTALPMATAPPVARDSPRDESSLASDAPRR